MKTRINLLPWRHAQAERRRHYFMTLLLAFVCMALAVLWLADQVIDQAIDRQVTRNNHLGNDIATQDSSIKTLDDLEAQSQQLAERMKIVQDLHHGHSSGAQLLDQLARAVPDGVHLHEVVAKGDTVSISGTAESSQDIAQLMRRLEASEGARGTRLQHVRTEGAQGSNGFRLMVRQGASSEAQP
ncbi:PilN domain-containing protein [Pseudomonas rhodesiae]|uniref:PilN domain-containing protein n=1 Tax=Pseudomonas rhodesiae TaxID=76760 RepID=UPI0032B21968